MKRVRFIILALTALTLTFGRLAAAETKTNGAATVTKVTGEVSVQLPGQSAPVAVTEGMQIPQGAIITSRAGEAYLQSHGGTVTTVKPNSSVNVEEISVTTDGGKVTKETTNINLRSGNVVSMLDPAKKAVNSYQVRTPKGVAAARGTTFTVSYNGVNYTIIATTGNVQITSSTGAVISISGGQASLSNVNGGTATAVQDLPAADKAAVIQAMSVAVATIAVAADQGMLGDAATGAAQLSNATATVLAAAPEAAASIAALVQASAPSQSSVVQQAIDAGPPAPTPTSTDVPPPTTTPQPIDPSTVSRSN